MGDKLDYLICNMSMLICNGHPLFVIFPLTATVSAPEATKSCDAVISMLTVFLLTEQPSQHSSPARSELEDLC